MKKTQVTRMVIAAVLLAVGMMLPRFLGGVQVLGQTISPLHIPALIAGLTLGGVWGCVVGALIPLASSLLGMPPLPIALPMAFECAAYGLLTGLLYPVLRRALKKDNHLPAILITLVIAMVGGRLVGGAAKALLLTFGAITSKAPFTMAAFISSYFVGTAVGAVIHLIVVPAVVLALEKAKLSPAAQAVRA